MRAELLVLRKWPLAWGLLLVTPAYLLLFDYLAELISYLVLTPAEYASYGNPGEAFASLTPSQFNIIAVNQFDLSGGTVPLIVLGAILAGDDWGRGTITTAMLQRSGRVRTFAGQALALVAAVTASVLASFAVAAAASVVIGKAEARPLTPYLAAMQPNLVLAKSAGAALLVALTYAMLGLFLGTACRSGAGAMAVALLWTVIIENNLWDLALQFPHGMLRTISDLTPAAAANTVTGLFGDPGGGATSQNYLTVSTPAAVVTLLAYLTAALILAMVIVRRRDAVAGPSRRLRLRRKTAVRSSAGSRSASQQEPRVAAAGVLASLRAELLIMARRPAVWALVLVIPADMLINSYFSSYVLYATANTGVMMGASQPLVLATMMPSQYLTAALNGAFGLGSAVYGAAVFMLLGALVGGSDWGSNTIRTALLQRPGRLRTCAGQALAVTIAVAASIALTFIAAAAASAAVALHQTGSLAPAGSQFPAFGHLAEALAAAFMLGLAYTAVGLTFGAWLRSATAATGAVLLWAVIIQPSIEYFAVQLHGVILQLYDILPDAATNTVINLDGNPSLALYGSNFAAAHVTPMLAFLTLGLYAAAFLAIPALITRRRDIT